VTGEWMLTISARGLQSPQGSADAENAQRRACDSDPSVVLDLGLADYVAWLNDCGEQSAVSPALRTKGERGELWPSFGDWWGGYLADQSARPTDKRPAREFRPTWATIARECGVSREAQEYLMGHAPDASDMNARYGSREPLRREMRKLSFDGWGWRRSSPGNLLASDHPCQTPDSPRVKCSELGGIAQLSTPYRVRKNHNI
jgi:hypothetical protein